jgi:hypothetical protein
MAEVEAMEAEVAPRGDLGSPLALFRSGEDVDESPMDLVDECRDRVTSMGGVAGLVHLALAANLTMVSRRASWALSAAAS